jgi:hypothetical protein
MNEFSLILKEIEKYYIKSNDDNEFTVTKNKMLIHLMDRCLRVASHLIPPASSEKAFERANKNNIDIFRLREKDRNKIEKQIKKSNPNDDEKFILEHFNPVNIIVKEMLSKQNDLSRFEYAIDKLKVVWILKSEDDVLRNNGHRTNRPNPIEAYDQAGIKIIENPKKEMWLK